MAGVIGITGRTYEQREKIRQLGCRWDAERRVWVVARAGMRGDPMYEDRARYDQVRGAIERGELVGVQLTTLR